jgi:transposase InsO family protein
MDEVLSAQVRLAFRDSGGTYGAPRIERELRAAALGTSTKLVARLMREGGLAARKKSTRVRQA